RLQTLVCCCSILKLNELYAEQGKPGAELNLRGWHQITDATNPYRFVSTPTSASDQVVPLTSTFTMGERFTLKQIERASTTFDNQPNRFPKLNANFEQKSGLINLLPKFYGRLGEYLIKHIKDFEVIYATTRRTSGDEDAVKAFAL
ncbi:hypothetical protein PIB30_082603, partial [Stylosanthes scabra]|nr:hypothetical protein [Stylosanthes scabra]